MALCHHSMERPHVADTGGGFQMYILAANMFNKTDNGTYKRNMEEASSCNHCCSGKVISITYCERERERERECVCVCV